MQTTLLQAVAKAIHVPVRRREDAAAAPSMAMKAAAVNLAVVLRRNFDFQAGFGWGLSRDLQVVQTQPSGSNGT